MSAEGTRRALAMNLAEFVSRYKKAATNFGNAVPFSAFGLSSEEASRVFSSFDEDYHISRFLHFTEQGGAPILINGVPATHVSLDAEIESLL